MRIKLILLLSNSADVTGSRKSKMLAAKPEISISQLVITIATKIQRLYPNVFGVQEHDRTNMNTFRCKLKWEIKWRPLTGSGYGKHNISACIHDSNDISRPSCT